MRRSQRGRIVELAAVVGVCFSLSCTRKKAAEQASDVQPVQESEALPSSPQPSFKKIETDDKLANVSQIKITEITASSCRISWAASLAPQSAEVYASVRIVYAEKPVTRPLDCNDPSLRIIAESDIGSAQTYVISDLKSKTSYSILLCRVSYLRSGWFGERAAMALGAEVDVTTL